MVRQHGTDPSGKPLDLIGQPLRDGRGSVPSLLGIAQEAAMPKAERDGVYRLGRGQFKTRKGATLPEGAVMVEPVSEPADEPVVGKTEERAQQAAPENKARRAAPEQK